MKDMKGKSFLSQYSPNLLMISGQLLELLGYNIEEFAVEAIKHQCVLYEYPLKLLRFFSSEHYARVIFKHLDNIRILERYFSGELDLGQVCQESRMVYEDWLYDRFNVTGGLSSKKYGASLRQARPNSSPLSSKSPSFTPK